MGFETINTIMELFGKINSKWKLKLTNYQLMALSTGSVASSIKEKK